MYQVDKFVEEYGDKVPEPDREELTKLERRAEGGPKGEDVERDQGRGTEAVMQASSGSGRRCTSRRQQGQQPRPPRPAAAPAAPSPSGEDDVVEGEIVDEGGDS